MISIERDIVGTLPTGAEIERYRIFNPSLRVTLMNLGATILSIEVPDEKGKWANVVLGNDQLADYLATDRAYFGSTCGRYANRISGGSITVDGVEHRLSVNEAPYTTLHGGARGFDSCLWRAVIGERDITLSLDSVDGDQGFPGDLAVALTFSLDGSSLRLGYRSTSNKATHVNLTNHSYFNLAGEGQGSVLSHHLLIEADHYLPNDQQFLPTGDILPVAGTPFDFTKLREIGQGMKKVDAALLANRGYNHTFALRNTSGSRAVAAILFHPESGRSLSIHTTEPGLHLYTAGFLDGTHQGPCGIAYAAHSGVCLETQHFPDSPRQLHFPSTLLRPGMVLRSETLYTFGVVS